MRVYLFAFLALWTGCSNLTHLEKAEIKYNDKFNLETATLLISSKDAPGGNVCLGTLLSPTSVLTSATCASMDNINLAPYIDPEGDIDPEDVPAIEVAKTAFHPGYKSEGGSKPHEDLAVIIIKPNSYISSLKIYYPKMLLYKKSHSKFINKQTKSHATYFEQSRPKNGYFKKESVTETSVIINTAGMPREAFPGGAVSSVRYHRMYMISGLLTDAQPQSATEQRLGFTALYKSRDFLSDYVTVN